MDIQIGDLVKKKSGSLFSNGSDTVTVERFSDNGIFAWFEETRTNMPVGEIEKVERGKDNVGIRIGDLVKKKSDKPFINGSQTVTVESFSNNGLLAHFEETKTNMGVEEIEKVERGDDVSQEQQHSWDEMLKEDDWDIEDFLFAGQRVILNPEHQEYRSVVERIDLNGDGTTAGYVVDHVSSRAKLKRLYYNDKRTLRNHRVKVQFDNGVKKVINSSGLLMVNSDLRKVTLYRFSDSGKYKIEGIPNKDIDIRVIKLGERHVKEELSYKGMRDEIIKYIKNDDEEGNDHDMDSPYFIFN